VRLVHNPFVDFAKAPLKLLTIYLKNGYFFIHFCIEIIDLLDHFLIIYRTTMVETSKSAVQDEWVPCFYWLIP
jgi:hypothetical protein